MTNAPLTEQQGQARARGKGVTEPCDELHLSRSRVLRRVYVALGFVSLVVGLIGLLLPIFPTSPFVLLAAPLFGRGSERFYRWLLNNPYCGQQIRSWRNNEGLTIRMKLLITLAIAGTMTLSTVFFVPYVPVKLILFLIAIAVSVYIWRQPTKRAAGAEQA